MLVVALISFAMFAYVGDPVSIMLGQDATEAQRDAAASRTSASTSRSSCSSPASSAMRLQGNFGLSYRLSAPGGAT